MKIYSDREYVSSDTEFLISERCPNCGGSGKCQIRNSYQNVMYLYIKCEVCDGVGRISKSINMQAFINLILIDLCKAIHDNVTSGNDINITACVEHVLEQRTKEVIDS
jgi:hypothetical protein